MRKQLIILLAAVIYSGPLGCFPAVICYGYDGHILLENPGHDHCDCSQKCACQSIHCDELCLKQNHRHCLDSLVNLTALKVTIQANRYNDVINVNFFCPEACSIDFTLSGSFAFQHTSIIESYFSPLHTIILQA